MEKEKPVVWYPGKAGLLSSNPLLSLPLTSVVIHCIRIIVSIIINMNFAFF